MTENDLYHRVLHVQKGDCADAIEGIGHDWPWSDSPRCEFMKEDRSRSTDTVCIATSIDNVARTYASVCTFLKEFHNATDLITVHLGLGRCTGLFGDGVLLHTEWFDIDEPCLTGDSEDALQNLGYVSNFQQTAPFRMCPKQLRKGNAEFQTTSGTPFENSGQVLNIDYKNDRLRCLNSEQSTKPPPPNYWFHKKIKCMDYKMRHQCECLYGCHPSDGGETVSSSIVSFAGGRTAHFTFFY